MILFTTQYLDDQAVLKTNYLYCYSDFKDIINRLCNMVEELVINNAFLDYNQAIKIIKIDNSEILRKFSLSELRSYIFKNEHRKK